MDRNCDILKHILKYCEDVLESIDLFGDDIEIFKAMLKESKMEKERYDIWS